MTYIIREARDRSEVLLGEKLTGIGVGKIVAPGGKSEWGENPTDTAVREIFEEVGLRVKVDDLSHIATIKYPFVGRPELSQRSFAFVVRDFEGEVQASSELDARWWPLEHLPLDKMWADAALWLPRALAGEFVAATISIAPNDSIHHVDFNSVTSSE